MRYVWCFTYSVCNKRNMCVFSSPAPCLLAGRTLTLMWANLLFHLPFGPVVSSHSWLHVNQHQHYNPFYPCLLASLEAADDVQGVCLFWCACSEKLRHLVVNFCNSSFLKIQLHNTKTLAWTFLWISTHYCCGNVCSWFVEICSRSCFWFLFFVCLLFLAIFH